MKKSTIIILAVVGVLVFTAFSIVSWGVSTYNSFVSLDEGVNGAWSQVQNQYQRRYDLIPNLVETVKGYAAHEKEVLVGVTEARAKVGQMNISPAMLNDPQVFQKFEQAQGGLSSALSRLMVVIEKYPDLKANQNFLQLQSQLEGTENRIAVERRRFNEVVQEFNTKIRQFPGSFIAGFGSFSQKAYFKADVSAQEAPKVKF
ncbi:MAG: LemA family protein [Bacteroidota bacterium]